MSVELKLLDNEALSVILSALGMPEVDAKKVEAITIHSDRDLPTEVNIKYISVA